MELKILTWNCRGWKNKYAELARNWKENKIDVGVIKETKLTSKDITRISEYDIVRRERNEGRGGGIIIQKDIK